MLRDRDAPMPAQASAPSYDGGPVANGVPEIGTKIERGGAASAAAAGSGTTAPRLDPSATGVEPPTDNAATAAAKSKSAAEPATSRFPDNWRQELAGADKTFQKMLDRFDSPAALAKAYRELTAKLSAGEFKAMKPPPDNATADQVRSWRSERGLPETAAAYVDGLQLGEGAAKDAGKGEAEKALLAAFAREAMKGHWTAQQYNQAVGWYFDLQGRLAAQRNEADAAFKHETSAELTREWGHDYAVNRNAIGQFLDRSFPEDFKQALLAARLPDGRILANHPAFNRAILELEKTINPGGALLPNASGAALSNVDGRIAEIERKYLRAPHGTDAWKSYWTGDGGARMQQEYRGLLAAREQTRRGRGG